MLDDAIDWRVRKRRLHRVHQAVYAVGHLSMTRNGHFMAAVLACGVGAALSHFSAAVLWGLLSGDGKIHVTAPTGRKRPGLVVHRAGLKAADVTSRAGIAVTKFARTLIDLADVAPRRTLERALDEAEFLRLDCTGLAPRHGRRGAGTLSSVLAVHAAGSTRTRSELEERFLALCDNHNLPRPEVNVYVEGYARAMRRDPIRDAELMIAGWRVWRVTYERLLREPEAVAEQLVGLGVTPAPPPAAPAAQRRS